MTKGDGTDKADNVSLWDWDKNPETYEEYLDFTAVPIMVIDANDNIRGGNVGDGLGAFVGDRGFGSPWAEE